MSNSQSQIRPALRGVQGSPEPCVVQGAIRNRLIVFTRFPDPGKSKTRLIPALGPEGAADLQRQMCEYTLSWVRRWKERFSGSLQIHFTGSSEESFEKWLGPDLSFRPQAKGDLGGRMAGALRQGFQEGMEKVVIVGTDCPGLSEDLAQQAFARLDQSEVALGPAKDGGYYLIGLRRPVEELFRGVPWGTGGVLAKTREIARNLDLRVSLLESLSDVDRPEDLPVWEKVSATSFRPSPLEGEGKSGGNSGMISIIIPTLNEEKNIEACLASAASPSPVERIVVDGGSADRTLEIARSCGAKVITSLRGRGRQMNTGAQIATGDFLLFLHADTLLPPAYADKVRATLSLPGIVAGAFEFRLDATSPGLRFIERVANWRSRRLQLPYGDQAIFLRSSRFQAAGGFPDTTIMEDYEFILGLKKFGRIYTAPYPATTSARRWGQLGTWRATLLNEAVVVAYYLGVSPTGLLRLARR
jgi:rSAM/selenodomain-associated transferase 2/rSAM/selenodomain-associated transferase 1